VRPSSPPRRPLASHGQLFVTLCSGHLATIACTLFKFDYDHIHYTRELIRVPDGGTIAVDIAPALEEGEDMDDRPILVVSQCVHLFSEASTNFP
jgi:predicted alpha/beta-fold hydrolase